MTSLIKEYPGLVTFHDVFGTNNLFISRGSGLYIKNYKYFKRKKFRFFEISSFNPRSRLFEIFLEFLAEIGFGVFVRKFRLGLNVREPALFSAKSNHTSIRIAQNDRMRRFLTFLLDPDLMSLF